MGYTWYIMGVIKETPMFARVKKAGPYQYLQIGRASCRERVFGYV